jgi:hypothetical protein
MITGTSGLPGMTICGSRCAKAGEVITANMDKTHEQPAIGAKLRRIVGNPRREFV